MRYLKKYNYLVLKILIIQETRNLLSFTFILVREKNISTIYFVSFLNLYAGKHKTLTYYLDLFPNFKSFMHIYESKVFSSFSGNF